MTLSLTFATMWYKVNRGIRLEREIMRTRFDSKANSRRWLLLLVNGLMAIGMFLVVCGYKYESRNVFGFWVRIPDYEFYYDLKNFPSTNRVCVGIAIAVLTMIPVVHVLKLMGVMGESIRNSAVVSSLLSVLELLGAFTVPTAYLMTYRVSDMKNASLVSAIKPITVWAYVLAALAIAALVLSICLKPTEQIVGDDLEDMEQGASVWSCPSCGNVNFPQFTQCRDCGASRPKRL